MADNRLERWRPELRRAMMRVRPEFFAWSVRNRERYGADLPEEDERRLHQTLMKELFGAKTRSWKTDTSGGKTIPLRELNRWNEAILPLVGVGEDCFFLNEWFGENKSILNFPTLRAYDEDDYYFQEDARKREDPLYESKAYRGSLYLTWARLFVEQQFTYATLSMAAGYIYAQLEDEAADDIKERIPYRYIPGKNHGKIKGKNFQWDMRADADGQEDLLEELEHRVFEYSRERYDVLLTDWDRSKRHGVYCVDMSEPQEHNVHFIFSDQEALSAVRFRSFVRDCCAIERRINELDQVIEEETTKLKGFIFRQHQELLQTFDSRVKPLRRRRQILIHNNAFDDFE